MVLDRTPTRGDTGSGESEEVEVGCVWGGQDRPRRRRGDVSFEVSFPKENVVESWRWLSCPGLLRGALRVY